MKFPQIFLFLVFGALNTQAASDLRWDEHSAPNSSQGKSVNLDLDISKMWKVVPLPENTFSVSPVSAIHAAERVFNAVDLKGKSSAEVSKTLKIELRSKNYGYVSPFFEPPNLSETFRFDCGNFGWQFDVIYDKKGKVKKVSRQWIH